MFKFSQKASAKCENIGSQRAAKFVCENVVKIIETKCENVFKKAAKPKASQNVVKKCENVKMKKCENVNVTFKKIKSSITFKNIRRS